MKNFCQCFSRSFVLFCGKPWYFCCYGECGLKDMNEHRHEWQTNRETVYKATQHEHLLTLGRIQGRRCTRNRICQKTSIIQEFGRKDNSDAQF